MILTGIFLRLCFSFINLRFPLHPLPFSVSNPPFFIMDNLQLSLFDLLSVTWQVYLFILYIHLSSPRLKFSLKKYYQLLNTKHKQNINRYHKQIYQLMTEPEII